MKIAFLEIIADLHSNHPFDRDTEGFINELGDILGIPLNSVSKEELKSYELPLFFVRSGGTEGFFKSLYKQYQGPFYLLTTGASNSLAASLEILTFLREQGQEAEILHGTPRQIADRIGELLKLSDAKKRLEGMRVGLIGEPSDWLIASDVDAKAALERFGMTLVPITIADLRDKIDTIDTVPDALKAKIPPTMGESVTTDALRIYLALEKIMKEQNLGAFTLRCFDLLGPYANTGCLALALFNDAGIAAGCEGDVPALITMAVMQALIGEPVFMANPSRIDKDTNELIIAHCTVPLTITDGYTLHTHFESDLGIGVRGKIPQGRGTICKIARDMARFFVSGCDITDNLERADLCRTQLRLKPDADVSYFLTDPLGNHHIVTRGDYSSLFRQLMAHYGLTSVPS